jgi:two-component sensor histidine kinase
MQIKETIDVPFSGTVERFPLEYVVVLVDRDDATTGVAVQRAFSARVRGVRGGSDLASRYVEIPIVGSNGEVSGILCQTSPLSDTPCVIPAGKREAVSATGDMAQFVHDINDFFAVIGSGLRLLEFVSDTADRTAIRDKMMDAIARGLLLNRQLIDGARSRRTSIDGVVARGRLQAIAGVLELSLPQEISVHTQIDPDLWAFDADAEELYFTLLNLCQNSADAMPDGGVITVAARNIDRSPSLMGRFVEIVVADDGKGMPEEVLSQAFIPNFTTKPSGGGLGLTEVRRFVEARDGAVRIESVCGAGTLVHLFLPQVEASELRLGIGDTKIAYSPSADGGVFRVINPPIAAPKL